MLINQNQYSGLEKDLPARLTPGSSYLCIDSGKTFAYTSDNKPKLVSTKIEFISQSEYDAISDSDDDVTYYIKKEE